MSGVFLPSCLGLCYIKTDSGNIKMKGKDLHNG